MRIVIHQDVSLVLHEPVDGISEIPSDLLHEIVTKGQRTRGQVNASSRKFHDEEQIVGYEPTFCPDFNGGEVDGCEHIPMRLDERLPSCLALPIWSWFDPMLFENVADGSIGNVIANVRQRALDPVVSPVQVFLGEAKDQIDDDLPDSWPADALALVAMIPFLATSVRCHRKIVSGVTMVVSSINAFLPRDLPLTAKSRRWSSLNRIRFFP